MKRCSECAEKIQNDAKVCRHCGHRFSAEDLEEDQARGRRNGIIGGLILVVIVVSFGRSCSNNSTPTSTSTGAVGVTSSTLSPVAATEKASIRVKPWSWGMSASGRYCDGGGTITNTGEVALRGVKIDLQFFDKMGNLLASDTAYTSVAELQPGQKSAFNIFTACPGNVESASITGATHRFGEMVSVSEK